MNLQTHWIYLCWLHWFGRSGNKKNWYGDIWTDPDKTNDVGFLNSAEPPLLEEEVFNPLTVEFSFHFFKEHEASFEVKALQSIADAFQDLPLSNSFWICNQTKILGPTLGIRYEIWHRKSCYTHQNICKIYQLILTESWVTCIKMNSKIVINDAGEI